jgi:hypothetical protein
VKIVKNIESVKLTFKDDSFIEITQGGLLAFRSEVERKTISFDGDGYKEDLHSKELILVFNWWVCYHTEKDYIESIKTNWIETREERSEKMDFFMKKNKNSGDNKL